jgi:hypothetical protein
MRSSHRQDFRTAIHLFDFASHPVNRRSASQFDYALPRALAGSSVGQLLPVFRRRERVRCRSQLYVPRIFTWISGPRYAAMESFSSSKPIAPSEQSSKRPTYGSHAAGQAPWMALYRERCRTRRFSSRGHPADSGVRLRSSSRNMERTWRSPRAAKTCCKSSRVKFARQARARRR